jgi:hypothetical protein
MHRLFVGIVVVSTALTPCASKRDVTFDLQKARSPPGPFDYPGSSFASFSAGRNGGLGYPPIPLDGYPTWQMNRSLSRCLSLSLSLFFSLAVCLCLSVSFSLSLSVSVSQSLFLSGCLSLSLSLFFSLAVCLCLSVCVCSCRLVCMSVSVSQSASASLSPSLSAFLSLFDNLSTSGCPLLMDSILQVYVSILLGERHRCVLIERSQSTDPDSRLLSVHNRLILGVDYRAELPRRK